MAIDDASWHARVERSIQAVRNWEARTGSPEEIEPGSSLDKDDTHWPVLPVSTLAWYGLLAAVDHLGFAADYFRSEQLCLRPSAFFSTTRGALLGASQAVWLLSGARADRVDRGLRVLLDERKNHRTFIKDHLQDAHVESSVKQSELDKMAALVTRLSDDITLINAARGDRRGRLDTTAMMREAAEYVMGHADPWGRRALSYEWRMGSAAAHARMWPLHIRQGETAPMPDGGKLLRFSSEFSEVAQSFSAAVLVTSEAWRLWDMRRHVPQCRREHSPFNKAAPLGRVRVDPEGARLA